MKILLIPIFLILANCGGSAAETNHAEGDSMAFDYINLGTQYYGLFNQGKPVANGSIYVGGVNLDPEIPANQKQVQLVMQDGSKVNVVQPVKTGAGGFPIYEGSPAIITTDGDYSIKVLDSSEKEIYYFAEVKASGIPSANEQDSISLIDGSAINPAIQWANYPDDGFYHDGTVIRVRYNGIDVPVASPATGIFDDLTATGEIILGEDSTGSLKIRTPVAADDPGSIWFSSNGNQIARLIDNQAATTPATTDNWEFNLGLGGPNRHVINFVGDSSGGVRLDSTQNGANYTGLSISNNGVWRAPSISSDTQSRIATQEDIEGVLEDVDAFYDAGSLVCSGVDIVDGSYNRKNILFDATGGYYGEFQVVNSSGYNSVGLASYDEQPAFDSQASAYIKLESDTDVGPDMTGFSLGSGISDIVKYRNARKTLDLYSLNGYDMQISGFNSQIYSGVKVTNSTNDVDTNETVFRIGDSTKFASEGELTTFTGGLQLKAGTSNGFVTARINGGISNLGGSYVRFVSSAQGVNPDTVIVGTDNDNKIEVRTTGVTAPSIATGNQSPIATQEDLTAVSSGNVSYPAVPQWVFFAVSPVAVDGNTVLTVGDAGSSAIIKTQALDDIPANAVGVDFIVTFDVTNSVPGAGAIQIYLLAGVSGNYPSYYLTVPNDSYKVTFSGFAPVDINGEFEFILDDTSGNTTLGANGGDLRITKFYN